MTTQQTTRTPMTSFQKTVIGLLIALVLAIVAATIIFLVVTRNQAIDEKKAECDRYPVGSVDYFLCIEQAEN